jgi:hypothetical protein
VSDQVARESCLLAIRNVFPIYPLPAVEALVDLPNPYDPERLFHPYDKELGAVRAFFATKTWLSVVPLLAAPKEQIRSALGYLLPDAARYYLPAYLSAVVTDWRAFPLATEAVVTLLLRPRARNYGVAAVPEQAMRAMEERWHSIFRGPSPGQLQSVRSALAFLADSDPAEFSEETSRIVESAPDLFL